MPKTLTISTEVYEQLVALAQAHGQTPEAALAALVEQQALEESMHSTGHISYSDEEWMRHLGMTDEDIAWVEAQPLQNDPA